MKKFFKKTFKRIKKGVKSIGRSLKKGLGKIGKAFGKLGPVGTLALSLMLPGLGSAFTSFGSWANTLSGPLGAVMKGIHTAGNMAGTVYSSVTEMVGGVVRNTIGKLPVGGGQTLASSYDRLTGWVSNKINTSRQKFGMETNMTDTSLDKTLKANENAIKNVSSIQENQIGKSIDATMKQPIDTSSLLKPTSNNIKLPDGSGVTFDNKGLLEMSNYKAGQLNMPDLKISDMTNLPKTSLDTIDINKLQTMGETIKVPVGYEKSIPKNIQENMKDLGFDNTTAPSNYSMKYKEVYKNNLTPKQLEIIDTTNTQYYTDYQNNRTDNFLKTSDDKTGQLKTRSLLTQDIKANMPTKLKTVTDILSPEEETVQTTGGVNYSTLLDTDVTSMNDYTRNAQTQPAYMNAGANDFSSMYAQGNYGGDIFTFANILRQRNSSMGIPSTLSTRNLT
tara:strand:+ start:922 stop:2262 length:1341 start_codon:yes stop_codon:yes gene_type:complete